MNHERFDQLAKGLVTNRLSRREVLKNFVAGAVVGVLPFLGGERAEAATCKSLGSNCTGNTQCCSKFCSGGKCRCKPKGKSCTANGQCCSKFCSGGVCRCKANGKTCTSGEQCCSGSCRGGVCIPQGCGSDLPTAASLAAARDMIAAGKTDVALSPGGCWRYRRTLNGTSIATETIREAGTPVLIWNHTATESIGEQDNNRDGFFERRVRIVRGATANDERIEVRRFSSKTRGVVRRETYTRNDNTIHVLWERDDGSGNLEVEAEFDTTLTQILTVKDPAAASLHARGTTSSGAESVTTEAVTLTKFGITVHDCTATQAEDLINEFLTGVGKGNRCMQSNSRGDIGTAVLDFSSKMPVNIICDTTIGTKTIAQINSIEVLKSWPFNDTNIEIRVNPNNYFSQPLDERWSTMWHEMLHLPLGPHDGQTSSSARWREIDRVYACESLCFTTSLPKTKCSCARCLGTNKCDARCGTFADCNADLGGWCPCSCRQQWYNSQATCAAECPSGLCCFASQCRGYDVFC